MKKNFLILLFFLNSYSASITYELTGGLFGDNLVSYAHAKWLSFIYQIPLLYYPFNYSDRLVLHDQETRLNSSHIDFSSEKFRKLNLDYFKKDGKSMDLNLQYCYVVPYFSEDKTEFRNWPQMIFFPVDWSNSEFKNELKRMISPIDKNLFDINLPVDKITVAVHIRIDFDGYFLESAETFIKNINYCNIYLPLKLPSIQYYIDQIKTISSLVDNQKIYLCIFTDCPKNVSLLFNTIKQHLDEYNNITFDIRYGENNYKNNVLSDFFALTKFDCLIRPASNFSMMAAKISDYDIEIFPVNYGIKDGFPYVTEVKIINNYKNKVSKIGVS